jgi:23S rRNA pseudouridine1911/1915/1917 synthase
MTHHVQPDHAGQTLAAVLRHHMPGQSWAKVKQMVLSRWVTLNGNVCVDPARRVKADDVIKLLNQPKAELPSEDDVAIVHVDAHVVVVEKPAGMTTLRHAEEKDWPARRKQLQPTLDELLPKVLAERGGRRPAPGGSGRRGGKRGRQPQVRPVHRLDRETSGLIVFARSVEAERLLGQQFRKHTIHRKYIAIALGLVEPMRIESYLVRDRGDGRRGSTTLKGVGKKAVTHVKPVEFLDGYTLLECTLETGRTHQIRIHLAEKGHPLCGEKVYNKPLFGDVLEDDSEAPRIALHAAELGFDHPITGERLAFHSPLPKDLASFLARLKSRVQ